MISTKIKVPGWKPPSPPAYQRHTQMGAYPTYPNDARMDKQSFIRFIESVKLRFKAGDLVTFSHFNDLEGTLPAQIYTLVHINEISYDCPMDESIKEPRCMVVQSTRTDGQYYPFPSCAGRLRKLSERELKLVELRNQPAQGTA